MSSTDRDTEPSESANAPKTLGSVIGHATVAVPIGTGRDSAGSTLEALRRHELEEVREIVVLEHQRPVGLVSIESLLTADPEAALGSMMNEDFPVVTFDTDEEVAAHSLVESGDGCLVVVGPGGGFAGLVFADQMLPVMLAEHEEDMARIGGYMAGSREARTAASEPVFRRLWHRVPWLLVGLLGAMLSAVLMSAFEEDLEANVLLALFVPAIVYMAGAVGSQTQTVLIRAFAVGVRTRDIFWREALTGAMVGVLIGAVFFVFAVLGWGDTGVALAVALALVVSGLASTFIAMALPSLFKRLGLDPAFGSGPLATLLQDLLSILVYFGVVGIVVL
jgi:magnesium transporter